MTKPTPRTEAGRGEQRISDFDAGWMAGEAYGRSEAAAQARTEALDVEALAGALGRVNDMATHAFLSDAEAIAREYQRILAAKETP